MFRRSFLYRGAQALGVLPWLHHFDERALRDFVGSYSAKNAETIVRDESFWRRIQQEFTVSPTILNLNNGGVSPQPISVQRAHDRYYHYANEAPSYYMWQILDKGREPLRENLAQLAGVDSEEIALVRNTSEALETVIFGLRLQSGDEVVVCHYDYPNMMNAWKQRAHRDGIVLKWVDLKLPTMNTDDIVARYVAQFTSKTKVVHLTHLLHWTGQIMPVGAIAREARKREIEVIADGAHSFAHIDYAIPDLACDYYGTSLHKWLCAPFGTGMLYVRAPKIKSLYPLFAAPDPESSDIRKFENLGTRSFATEQAIGQAINFHYLIGTKRKAERLFYLKNYWVERVQKLRGVRVRTPLQPDWSGALALLEIEGRTGTEIHQHLWRNHKIHTVPIPYRDLDGVRITPNVYTLTSDLDRLVRAISELV